MRVRFRKKYLWYAVITILILYLLWGPLFTWNPKKSGYVRIASSKATVYIKDYIGESVVDNMDELIGEEEKFHKLLFKKKFKIIIPGTSTSMKRYLRWLKGKG